MECMKCLKDLKSLKPSNHMAFYKNCIALVMTVAVSNTAFAKRLIPVDTEPTTASGLVVTVKDEKSNLTNARVWVESQEGSILAHGETEKDGRFFASLSDSVLAKGVTVTAFSSQHGAVSVLENVAHGVTLELPTRPIDSYAVLGGGLSGFKENNDENKALVGIVSKALELADLSQLDSSSFMSPLKDQIELFGSRDIPSNLVIPNQTFNIFFIPIHLNKPNYRLPVLEGSSSQYFGVTGTVNVREAVNAIRNKNGWDIVNMVEFSTIGLTPQVPVNAGNETEIRLDVTADTPIQDSIRLQAGRNTSAEESHRMAVALWEPTPGVFVPTDVKVVQDDLSLSAIDSRTARVMDVIVDKKANHFRGAWVNTTQGSLGDAGLSSDLVMDRGYENTWMIRGGENAQAMVAHCESMVKTSVGNKRYEDLWTLVGPHKAQLKLPVGAYQSLKEELGKVSHVSVDLLQMAGTGYPFLLGEKAASELLVLEKVRKEIQNY